MFSLNDIVSHPVCYVSVIIYNGYFNILLHNLWMKESDHPSLIALNSGWSIFLYNWLSYCCAYINSYFLSSVICKLIFFTGYILIYWWFRSMFRLTLAPSIPLYCMFGLNVICTYSHCSGRLTGSSILTTIILFYFRISLLPPRDIALCKS